MPDDLDGPLVLIRDIFAYTDTGYIRRPPELIGVKQASVRFNVNERTLRRYCEEKGLAFKLGKTWLVVVPALQALLVNDTGGLVDAQHDIKVISKLTGWPIRPSTPQGAPGDAPAWQSESVKEASVSTTASPTRYPDILRLKTPEGMLPALEYLARSRAQSTSVYVRDVILKHLEQQGLSISDTGAIDWRTDR